ncbi:MAG: shikimate dehydrogenase [Gemmatimonadota bacterium]|nr:shikimate dehydrogenase [Gemmatimonadota bacterium]
MIPGRLVLIGDPVSHSLSPAIQNAALAAAGLDVRYEAVRVDSHDLEAFVRSLIAKNVAGNVTIPHKEAIFALCDERTAAATRVGAVNTFWVHEGMLVGDNTDVGGFDAAASAALKTIPDALEVAVLGAGGSAAAVLGAAGGWPSARVRLYSRTPERAQSLARRFGDFVRVETSARAALEGAKLVVNATPVGMNDEQMPLHLKDLSAGAVIVDLVYGKNGTPLTRAAAAAGFNATDGRAMLVEQAALAFERWFGFAPDRDVMRAAMN